MKRFIPFDPDQPLLLPPDLRDALPAGHLALLLIDLVEQLDLSEIYAKVADECWGGKPGFDPRMLVRVWLYAYANGVRSSRKVAQALIENVAYRVVANNQTPGHWALNRFRTQHHQALGNLLIQTVKLASELGLVKLGNVAIDGTKIKANASKHKAMSYGRMDEAEERLKADIDAYLKDCDQQDEMDDRTYGPDDDGVSLPEELRDVQARRNKIAAAKRELERRAKERRAAEQEQRRLAAEAEGRSYRPRQQVEDAIPKDSEQVNFTDPESRIMLSGNGEVLQGYNAQASIDTGGHIVLAAGVSNQAADTQHLPDLITESVTTTGGTPEHVTADPGYYSESNVEHVEALGAVPLIPPDKVRRREWRAQQSPRGRIPNDLSPKDRMRRRLATKEGKRLYLQRQGSIEPLFGNTKHNRGLRQFLHRGVDLNHHLFRFDMAVHNVLKILKEQHRRLAPQRPRQARPDRANRQANALLTAA